VWDEDGVRDDLRDYVAEHLGDPGGGAGGGRDRGPEEGHRNGGGAAPVHPGTAGRVENAQVAVLLVYATDAGHAVIDRELYLPRSWTRDPERCRAAGVPAQVGFATKPALARRMLARALDAGVPAAWVTGDEVYGADPGLRACLEARSIGYVLAVACDHPVLAGGKTWRADALLKRVPARAWQCISAGKGAKGHRYYDWAFVQLGPGDPGQRWLLVRRNRKTGELAFYHCWMPHPVPLAVLVRVAGRRWCIEERIQTGKGLCGLDQHQVRRWRSWYRWTTLAMLAHAFLVVAALTERTRHPPPSDLISLTCNEVQHLFAALLARPAADAAHRLRWSVWRRRQQARARTCHYRVSRCRTRPTVRSGSGPRQLGHRAPERLAEQSPSGRGPGKVAVCTKCPNMPAPESLPAWTNAAAWRHPRRSRRTNGTNREFPETLAVGQTRAPMFAGASSTMVSRVVQDGHEGVAAGGRVRRGKSPAGACSGGAFVLGCRGGPRSLVSSATAVRALDSSIIPLQPA
jgi:SRSO17 transposase